jgi:hypothetical protein
MNLAGRISFACVVVISAAGLVAAVAGLGARVWPVVAVGAGFFLSGLFAAVVVLVAAGSGTEAGFTALDQWLQEQSQPREA